MCKCVTECGLCVGRRKKTVNVYQVEDFSMVLREKGKKFKRVQIERLTSGNIVLDQMCVFEVSSSGAGSLGSH